MKKSIYLAFMVLFCACQNSEELLDHDNGTDGLSSAVTVNFTLPEGLQSRATRAYGDGTTVSQIRWAVYKSSEITDNKPTKCYDFGVIGLPDGKSGLEGRFVIKNLPIGETFDFVFWAEHPDGNYTFNEQTGTVDMNYYDTSNSPSAACNDEKRDAFFRSLRNVEITRGLNLSVVLVRPFAQLNILTDDLRSDDDNEYYVKLGSGTFYDQLNLLTGKAGYKSGSGTSTTTFKAAKASKETLAIQADGTTKSYSVITMNYILMDGDETQGNAGDQYKELHTVYLYKNGKSLIGINNEGLANVPFKRNYRTNIYGSLLTTSGSCNYMIQPAFDGDLRLETLIATEAELRTYLNADRDVAVENTITLSANIELTQPLDITTAGKVKIDLRGHDIKGITDNGGFTDKALITLRNKYATLTITDSSTPEENLEGYGNLGKGIADYVIHVYQGDLILEKGDFHGKYGCVKWMNAPNESGSYLDGTVSPTVQIKGGTFSAAEIMSGETTYRLLDFGLEVPGGVKNWDANNIRNFVVFGGEFKGFNPASCKVQGYETWNFLPSVRCDGTTDGHAVNWVLNDKQSTADGGGGCTTHRDQQNNQYSSDLNGDATRYVVTYDSSKSLVATATE